ncbi:DUF2631 domain-containing protein [Nocardia thailandica]|uniref:DUF2631 domain-containing protein n=1 Tax=Nocardia thailandica TaxID=257275 RepID=A0ABW6PSN3_9NOCA|nr:DUF2631 domain-containing protein [Nocardia thailandica]
MAATELAPATSAVVTKVDPAEVPSAAFGWSGESPKTFKIAGWVTVVALLAMLFGNHHGHVEDIFLVGTAGLIALILVLDTVTKRIPR